MRRSFVRVPATWSRGMSLLPIVITMMLVGPGVPAASAARADAGPCTDVIVLPGATSAEGIAKGPGATFYAGDVFRGDIYRGDLRRGTAERFIDVPDGRYALGMFVDARRGRLFVAGGYGAAHVYDTRTGATVASYRLGDPASTLVNDVTITRRGAYFTDSRQARLYFVPIGRNGALGRARTIPVTGPAADTSGEFNLNGIVATPDGKTLIVSHTALGRLYTVDPATGVSRLIEGLDVPRVDGIVLEGRRLWAVQNFVNQVSRIRLNHNLTSGTVERVITHEAFQVPATAIPYGRHLAVVNAKFDTGVPPTADQYEVVLVRR
ncbi:SMP-30/gluconolactonase/LRE family protein [Micromonospora sp. BQ11]|uniref:SMP-30/gluconolactonase/LRE family protein n=1 Tax=Micromonospora sp. BQ11 TaxID=3452212 RepID=UPI003F8AAE8D